MPDETNLQNEVLTLTEAAALLRVCERTLRRQIDAKRIRAMRVGNQLRFDRAKLLKDAEKPLRVRPARRSPKKAAIQ